ncbi:GM10552 [Drosophila sechellia]|uniref:GM10552 n=1 Tax=Drosophila sechellia TaxID=7238 RepID=B4IEM6_DROSE|nr:GM10552 [Drosophila sechellia]
MYAAAGGASLASRQARQRQRQQKKTQQLQAKLHPPKAAGLASDHAAEGASTPTRSQSRQFHQLPQNYLRAPQPHGRKLSATYTTQSKLLLPIEEGDTQSVSQLRMHSHAHSHGHAYAHSHSHSHGPAHAAPAPLSHHGADALPAVCLIPRTRLTETGAPALRQQQQCRLPSGHLRRDSCTNPQRPRCRWSRIWKRRRWRCRHRRWPALKRQ